MSPTVPAVSKSPYSQGRQSLIVAALAFAGMGASFMQTILIPIQGSLPKLLQASQQDTAWVITITLLTSAVSTPIVGKLGDMFGKREVAVILLVLLAFGSLVCSVSQGLLSLIAGRALQGLGMGVIPLGISLLRDLLDDRRLGSAVALLSATLGVGGAIGLPVSALVTENLHWHMLFVLATILSLVSLVLVLAIVPKGGVRSGGRVDVMGGIGLAIGLTSLLLAISRGSSWGWAAPTTLACVVTGFGTLMLWAWYELRTLDPLVDLRLSVSPPVLMTNLASVAMGFALFASNIAFPQMLQLPEAAGGLGLNLLLASLLVMPAGLAMLAISPIAGRMERASGPRPLLIAGALVMTSAYLVCVLIPLNMTLIAAVNILIGIGIGLGYAAMPSLIMAAVPREATASANGLNTLMRSFGTTTASAAVGSVLAESAGGNQAGSFWLIFLMGLLAAALCAALAFFIPVSTKHEKDPSQE